MKKVTFFHIGDQPEDQQPTQERQQPPPQSGKE
jgi:hypothetical protein